jgi:hypothetical protein
MLRGLAAVDRRSLPARVYIQNRADMIDQLGGEASVTPTQHHLIELVCRGLTYLNHLDAVLLEKRSILNGNRSRLLPLVHDRRVLADSITKQLGLLGFGRVTRVKSLAQELLQ